MVRGDREKAERGRLGLERQGLWQNSICLNVHKQQCIAGRTASAGPTPTRRYRGQFLDGRRHGEGALLYSSGARYEGTWAADRKEGEGVYVFEDGTVFEGRFVADRPDVACGRFSFGSSGAPSDGGNSGGNGGSGANSGSSGGGSAAGAAATPEKGGRRGAAKGADSAAASGSTQAGPAPPPAAAGAHLPAQPAAGFGPRVASLQLYIDDLLEGTEAPPAAAKAVLNLLVGANPELRALYDRYW